MSEEIIDEYVFCNPRLYYPCEVDKSNSQTLLLPLPLSIRAKIGLSATNSFNFEFIIRRKK